MTSSAPALIGADRLVGSHIPLLEERALMLLADDSMKKPFSIGKITAEPGEVAKGFIPTVGLEMPDGTGNFWPIPVVIINGTADGPVFEVDGAIHANEQIGTLTVLELVKRLDPEKISGAFVGVPVFNVKGFLYSGELGYMHDAYNKNMNRVFPGNPNSPSATERAVNTFWNEVILKADFSESSWDRYGAGSPSRVQ